ncbi:hypothetical protein J4414_01980 [Candidatus Woesearchaeota archaeon]|nr:hypothetical protein [Candidatus Woesearchaeota archaeon]
MVTIGIISGRTSTYKINPNFKVGIGDYRDRSFGTRIRPNYPAGNILEKVNNPVYRIKYDWYQLLRKEGFKLTQRSIEDAINKGVGKDSIFQLQEIADTTGRGRLDEAFDNNDLVTKILLYKKL